MSQNRKPSMSGPPPGLEGMERHRRRSRNTDLSSGNPRFGRGGSSISSDSPRRTTPVGEVFAPMPPRAPKVYKAAPPSKPHPNSKRTNTTKTGSDNTSDDAVHVAIALSSRSPAPPKVGRAKSLLKSFSLGSKGDEDSDFDPNDIEDIDYDQEFANIEHLPFWEKMEAKKVPGRVTIALVAVCLLWLTSLGFIKYIFETLVFPAPLFEELIVEAEVYANFTEDTKTGYTGCNTLQHDRCVTSYNQAHDAELNTVDGILNTNADYLSDFEDARRESKIHVNNTLNTLVAIVATGELIPGFLNVGSSLSQCPTVKNYIEGQISSSSAASSYQNFASLSDEAVQQLINQQIAQQTFSNQFYADKRAQLDKINQEAAEKYAAESARLMNEAKAGFGSFQECITGASCPFGGISLSTQITTANETILGNIADKRQVFDQVDAQADDFFGEYRKLLDTVDKVNGALGPLTAGIPTGQPSSQPAEQPSINFDQIFSGNDANPLGNADTLFEPMGESLNGATTSAGNAASDFTNAATDFTLDGIEEYKPPTLDPTAKDQYDQDQAGFKDEFLGDVEGIGTSSDTDDDFTPPAEKKTNFTQVVDDVVTQFGENREFDLFSYPASLFEDMSLKFQFAINVGIWGDIIFRIVHTFLIINKYWNLSKIGKPPGDARVLELQGKQFGMKKSANEKLIARLTHPALLNGFLILSVLILVTLGWKLYEPFYEAFTDGCVEHDAVDIDEGKSSGTMIYRNLYSSAFSYAVEEGDQISSTLVDKQNVQRETDCQEAFQSTSETMQNQLNLFGATRDDYEKTLRFKTEIDICLNLQEMDSFTQNANVPGASITVDEMSDVSFEFDVEEPANGVYNCSAVPLCDAIRCADPEALTFEGKTHNIACNGELWLHANLASTIVIILTFVLLHMFRKSFMRALVRLMWRQVNPYDFTVLASCTRAGEHLDPEMVKESGYTFKDAASIAVRDAIKKWEKQSTMYMIYALMLNVPWIFAASFLSSGLDFKPATNV